MSLYTKSVITELRQKTSNGFDTPVKLGAEQRYVGSLLNSHNNNLEEQSILGLDCLSITWEEEHDRYTTKKFYNGDLNSISDEGYYILFITEFGSDELPEFEFGVNSLILGTYDSSKGKIESAGDGSSVLVADNADIYYYDASTGTLRITPPESAYYHEQSGGSADEQILSREVLCFRTNKLDLSDTQSNSDIIIAIKTTTRITNNNKTYVKQSIVNYLNG